MTAETRLLPLIANRDLDAPLAWRAGVPFSTRQFLADVARLAPVLPAEGKAVNLCIDRMRKLSHGKTVDIDLIGGMADPAPTRDPAESGERTETRARVHLALDRLPPKYKAVLTLRDIQGFSCEEISEIVGCTNATVRWRLHRARKLFRAIWEGKGVQIGDDSDVGF